MGVLVEGILRWIYRHFLSLLLIIAVLIIGGIVKDEYEHYRVLSSDLSALKSGGRQIGDFFGITETETTKRIAKIKGAPIKELNSRMAAIEQEIQVRRTERQKSTVSLNQLLKYPIGSGFIDSAKLDIEIEVLQQEWEYLDYLRALITGPTALEQIRKQHVAAYIALKSNESSQDLIKENNKLTFRIPGTTAHRQFNELNETHANLIADNQRAYDSYVHKKMWLDTIRAKNIQFVVLKAKVEKTLQPIYTAISERENNLVDNWFGKISRPVLDVLPTALLILLSIIVVPIGIKATFYFVLAPLASRRPPICLLPNESGIVDGNPVESGQGQIRHSFVSLKMEIKDDEELLVHPEYLQSSTITGKKDTKWLLDYSYPWSSLLSGMFALTRIRTDRRESIVLSATKDPLSELSVISLPKGSAVVMQPRNLIGVSYKKDQPVKISRHWRIFSLHAWLTLQLRYLVFHGPSKLIVKGRRGVRVEKAGAGRRINQAATIGFSASLCYSTSRCETFASYLMGKQELLNDSFDGEAGYYIYEETPHFGKRAGITGRGLEGLTDSVLKILGI